MNHQEIKIQNNSTDTQQTEYYLVNGDQKYQIVLNEFLKKINQEINKEFIEMKINSVYSQYIHSHMHVFYATSNNGQKITICLSIYDFQPGTSHGFIDSILDGHKSLQQCEKVLKELQKWPNNQSYHLSDEGDINQVSNLISNRIEIINQQIGVIDEQEEYKIIRCWTQTIEGINYFVHAQSSKGLQVTILIFIPQGEQLQIEGQDECQISLKCCKGIKTMEQFEEIINFKK